MQTERVWFQNVKELFKYPSRFWPTRDQSPGGQVNAVVRLLMYVTLVTYAYNREDKVLYFGIFLVTLASMAYNGKPGGRLATIAPTKCRRPSRHNPFMNTLIGEYGKEHTPPCDYEDVKEDVRKHFNHGLPRDIEDIYEKQNSQREFLSMPNGGLPPDSRQFAEFLYGGMKNCKTFPAHCTGYD